MAGNPVCFIRSDPSLFLGIIFMHVSYDVSRYPQKSTGSISVDGKRTTTAQETQSELLCVTLTFLRINLLYESDNLRFSVRDPGLLSQSWNYLFDSILGFIPHADIIMFSGWIQYFSWIQFVLVESEFFPRYFLPPWR